MDWTRNLFYCLRNKKFMEQEKNAYGKRPLWQWILIYIIIAGVVYGAIYYFVSNKNGGYNTNTPYTAPAQTTNNSSTVTPTTLTEVAVNIKNFSFSPTTLNIKT